MSSATTRSLSFQEIQRFLSSGIGVVWRRIRHSHFVSAVDNEALQQEAISCFVWSLAQNSDCYKQWVSFLVPILEIVFVVSVWSSLTKPAAFHT